MPHKVITGIIFDMECANGRKATRLIQLNGRKEEDVTYMVSKRLTEASGKYGLDVWIAEHRPVYDVPVNVPSRESLQEDREVSVPTPPINYILG